MELRKDRDLVDTDIHAILGNRRRRHALDHLRETPDTVAISDLADAVAEREAGESPPPEDLHQSVYNSLHQSHIPRLEAEDVIEYDRETNEIRLTESAREVEVYMEVFTRYGITWVEYYRLLGTVSLLVLLLATMDVYPFDIVDTVLWVSLFLSVIAVSTAYQLWTRRYLYLRQLQ